MKKMNWWLIFALSTVACWGLYGIALHGGAVGMGDKENGRYKAFLLVGLMYFLIAVVAPLIMLIVKGADLNFFKYPQKGLAWASIAGILGAIGAFGVLLAFGAGGKPAVVMAIVFAGAPVLNAIVAISMHPPKGGVASIRWEFFLGIALAAVGGFLVTKFKPEDAPKPPTKPVAEAQQPAEG